MKAAFPSLLLVAVLLLPSCNKEEPSPAPVTPADTTSNVPGTFGFQLDGTSVSISGVHAILNPLLNDQYELVIAGATDSTSASLTIRTDTLGPQFIGTPYTGDDSFSFVYQETISLNSYTTDTFAILGSVAIVQWDTTNGGTVEGIFNADAMLYLDSTGNIITSGHSVVGGFSAPIQQ